MTPDFRRRALAGSCLALALALGACATSGDRPAMPVAAADAKGAGAAALSTGKPALALSSLMEAAAQNPLDPSVQTMLGLAYQTGAPGDAQSQALALAGYELALRAEPGQFWAAALAGRIEFDRGRYAEAAGYFAQAVMARPSDPDALYALAAGAYMSGDTALAAAAAERSNALHPRKDGARLAALAYAAAGDSESAGALLVKAGGTSADRARIAGLIRTRAVDAAGIDPTQATPAATAAPNQISVDVAIVLSQSTVRNQTGVNLLDGLRLQYARSNQSQESRSGGAGSLQRVIVEQVGIPQLTYNLNILNRAGQHYQVVARPSLTAYKGEPSEFFIGRTLKVAVAGVNTAALEQIDVGIEMQVQPVEITETGARLKINTGRSFLSAELPGTFDEALATFRQRVSATAEVKFGETLILSGLSESVDDTTFSRTPGLGAVPVAGSLFSQTSKQQRRDAVLILVTPHRVTSLPGRDWARPESVERLAALWTEVVDPSSNATDVAARLRNARLFTRMSPGDAPLAWPNASAQAGEIARSLLLPGL